jgi:Transglutaminase-like enzymes, putative cysteine proteases
MRNSLMTLLMMAAALTSCGHHSSRSGSLAGRYPARSDSKGFVSCDGSANLPFALCDSTAIDTYGYDPIADYGYRIGRDFFKDEASVREFIRQYYPNLTDAQMKAWESSKALECMVIGGRKMYFKNAARNVFRIDKSARAVFDSINGRPQRDSFEYFLDDYLPKVVADAKKSRRPDVMPVRHTIHYELSVHPGAVPAGEVIRCWMPYPRTDMPLAQKDIKLVSTSQPDYIIAPDCYHHKSIYMEKKAEAGKPTVFTFDFTYTETDRWYGFDESAVKPYVTAPSTNASGNDAGSSARTASAVAAREASAAIYREYTAERAPHIVFSPRIRRLADSLTAGIDNPYRKFVSIYSWIVANFPWASAREYSTLDNIPEYVLDNRHGDCGQVGMLLITMCRCAGIPARWESGWMLHPGDINLHDWGEAYFEGVGWVPVDVSFGRGRVTDPLKTKDDVLLYYTRGLDAYRLIVNDDWGRDLYPAKIYPRSETVDFQRGEVEWQGGNLYFDKWSYDLTDKY